MSTQQNRVVHYSHLGVLLHGDNKYPMYIPCQINELKVLTGLNFI